MSKINIPAGYSLVSGEAYGQRYHSLVAPDGKVIENAYEQGAPAMFAFLSALAAVPTPPVDVVLGEPVAPAPDVYADIHAEQAKRIGSVLSIKGAERANLSPKALDMLQRGADALSLEVRQSRAEKAASIASIPLAAPVASRAVQAESVFYIDEEMAGLLRQTIGDDGEPNAIKLHIGDGHSGQGLYASLADHPEEGAIQLVESSPTAPAATAEPSEPDVPDIIAGAMQCSRGYAYTLMERAIAGRWDEAVTPDRARAASLAPREPLSDARIRELWTDSDMPSERNNWTTGPLVFARAIEREIAASPAGAEGATNV